MTASAREELVGEEENTVTICSHLWDQLKLFSALVFARSKEQKENKTTSYVSHGNTRKHLP